MGMYGDTGYPDGVHESDFDLPDAYDSEAHELEQQEAEAIAAHEAQERKAA